MQGHFEIDLLKASNHETHLLTVVDRNILVILMRKVKSKAAANVNKKIRIGNKKAF